MQSNPFAECLTEIIDAGDEWAELRKWLAAQSDKYDANPRFSQFTNAAKSAISLCGGTLATRPKLRQQLIALTAHFDAVERATLSG